MRIYLSKFWLYNLWIAVGLELFLIISAVLFCLWSRSLEDGIFILLLLPVAAILWGLGLFCRRLVRYTVREDQQLRFYRLGRRKAPTAVVDLRKGLYYEILTLRMGVFVTENCMALSNVPFRAMQVGGCPGLATVLRTADAAGDRVILPYPHPAADAFLNASRSCTRIVPSPYLTPRPAAEPHPAVHSSAARVWLSRDSIGAAFGMLGMTLFFLLSLFLLWRFEPHEAYGLKLVCGLAAGACVLYCVYLSCRPLRYAAEEDGKLVMYSLWKKELGRVDLRSALYYEILPLREGGNAVREFLILSNSSFPSLHCRPCPSLARVCKAVDAAGGQVILPYPHPSVEELLSRAPACRHIL